MLPKTSSDENAMDELIDSGIHSFGVVLDPVASQQLLRGIRGERGFGTELFLTEQEFDTAPQYSGVNPRPGRNLLEKFTHELGFLEENPEIVKYLSSLLGPGYRCLDRKLVAGIPESVVPEWLKRRIRGNYVNNLGAYIRPEFRDMTYFWGIDLHQDIIDWKSRAADFVTLYAYLDEVTDRDAPLVVLPGSHRFGATTFPHNLGEDVSAPNKVVYADDHGRTMSKQYRKLVGPAGTVNLWHAFLLHGTQPDVADRERISLRYLIARDPDCHHCGIDLVNEKIEGAL